ncbi:hypothetical protein AMECASPLE_034218 [Ameca splendens]|uniref:Uncharacterized protein n=1 Tax=Ameca splendens TaxID=208324 RepID=A0ABV0Y7P6_9TELE
MAEPPEAALAQVDFSPQPKEEGIGTTASRAFLHNPVIGTHLKPLKDHTGFPELLPLTPHLCKIFVFFQSSKST